MNLEFPGRGIEKSLIFKRLNDMLMKDPIPKKHFGTMYCQPGPHPFALEVFTQNVNRNAGDPEAFPGTIEVEKEVMQMFGSLLGKKNAVGAIVTGGSEGNVIAMWVARNMARKPSPEVVLPASVHYSYEVAADLLGLRPRYVGLDNYRADPREVEKAINEHTCAIACTAGTTALGIVDPVEELGQIAEDNNLFLHVDAALGGFVLPFMEELGYAAPKFDFDIKGVAAITADPHKMGLTPIPGGGILLREKKFVEAIPLEKTHHFTISSTRSGGSVLSIWALFKLLGREGYRNIVKKCLNLTQELKEGAKEIQGLDLVVEPETNVVAVKSKTRDIEKIAEHMRKNGWGIKLKTLTDGIKCIRLVVNPHVEEDDIKKILEALEAATKASD